jgi:hypothetical protein
MAEWSCRVAHIEVVAAALTLAGLRLRRLLKHGIILISYLGHPTLDI